MSIAEIMNNLIPLYLMFALGFILKKLKVISVKDARAIFLLVFNALTPAMFLYSIPKVELSLSLLKFPLFTVGLHIVVLTLGRLIYKLFKIKIDKVQFIAGLMIINLGFILPFYVSKYNYDGVWQVNLFDLGNAIMVFFFVQYFFANDKVSLSKIRLKETVKILKSPPIVAIFLGIIINLAGVTYPKAIENFLYKLVFLNSNLIILGLGVYFSPKFKMIKESFQIIGVKMLLGIIITIIANQFFGFEDSAKTLLFLIATSPVGTNNITFAVIYKDEKAIEFASSFVSISLLIGMVVSSIVLIFV